MRTRRIRRSRLAVPALVGLALLVAGAAYSIASPVRAVGADAAQLTEGKNLFQANCATCHGTGAQGSDVAPSLVGVGAAAVDFQLATGRMPMQSTAVQAPAKPAQMDTDQRAALAAWVASLGPGPAIPDASMVDASTGNPSTGMELFRTNCAMCHNAVGSGGALTQGKYAPSLRKTSPTSIYEAMLTGPGSMPVFNDANITPEQKKDVIAFLAAQEQGSPGGVLDLGALGPVSEGLWGWIVGIGLCIAGAVWIGAKSS